MMNHFEGPSDQPRHPFSVVATCLCVLLLGYLFSCLGSAEGTTPQRAAARQIPFQLPISTPGEQGMDVDTLAAGY